MFAFSSQQIVGFFPRLFNASTKVISGQTDLSTFFSETVMDFSDVVMTPTQQARSTTTATCMASSTDASMIFNQPTFFCKIWVIA
jgi:hypothetical protein